MGAPAVIQSKTVFSSMAVTGGLLKGMRAPQLAGIFPATFR
jgi:hypothetical protein